MEENIELHLHPIAQEFVSARKKFRDAERALLFAARMGFADDKAMCLVTCENLKVLSEDFSSAWQRAEEAALRYADELGGPKSRGLAARLRAAPAQTPLYWGENKLSVYRQLVKAIYKDK